MKIVYLLILCFVWTAGISQVSGIRRVEIRQDTNRVMIDEQGNSLKYYQYVKLLQTGDYTIRIDGDPSLPTTKFYLKKLTPDEKARMMMSSGQGVPISDPIFKTDTRMDTTPLLGVLDKNYFDKKVFLLVFWDVDCDLCSDVFAQINDFTSQYNTDNLIIMLITADLKEKAMSKLNDKPLVNARLASGANNIISFYHIRAYPAYVITDKDRMVKLAISGISNSAVSKVKSTLEGLLKQ